MERGRKSKARNLSKTWAKNRPRIGSKSGNSRQVALSLPHRLNATGAIGLPSHSRGGGISMRKLWFALLLSGSFLLAQDTNPSTTSQHNSKVPKGQVAVQGCVGRSNGDYVL